MPPTTGENPMTPIAERESCYLVTTANVGNPMQITLLPESSEKLRRIAARVGASEEAVASVLLADAIDRIGPDVSDVAQVLDRLPGAWERIQAGIDDARADRTIPLDDL
jgi:hypothetical protein